MKKLAASLLFLVLCGLIPGCPLPSQGPSTVTIFYSRSLNFIVYHNIEGEDILDQAPCMFAAFKIEQIENTGANPTDFSFDPRNLELLNLPPLPDGPNGQPLESARQVKYATRPAGTLLVPAGKTSGASFIGSVIFRVASNSVNATVNPGQCGVDSKFRLIYKGSVNVSMQPRPDAVPPFTHTAVPSVLASAGI